MSDKPARGIRVSLNEPATLIDQDGNELAVTVADISADGFQLHSVEQLEVGERVTLRGSRLGDLQAEIRWVSTKTAGGVFLSPVGFVSG